MSTPQGVVRPPAVAGTFYPAERGALLEALRHAFAGARDSSGGAPKALVVPHAGYVYSGPVAASAYRRLTAGVRRVVVLGPSHFVPFAGLAVSGADAFESPLGEVPVDAAARRTALEHPAVRLDESPHAREHSLEVQLPFLQRTLGDFELLPLAVGTVAAEPVAELLAELWGGPETLAVVSTDLSHYCPYEVAAARDRRTASAVLALRSQDIADDDACGAYPLRGLLLAARRAGLRAQQLDLRSSGDTAGDRRRVVGYAAFALE